MSKSSRKKLTNVAAQGSPSALATSPSSTLGSDVLGPEVAQEEISADNTVNTIRQKAVMRHESLRVGQSKGAEFKPRTYLQDHVDQFGDTVAGAVSFTESIAKGLQNQPQFLDPVFAAAEKIAVGASLADLCCALGSIKRTSDQVFDLTADKRHITIAGVLARAAYFAKALPQLEKAYQRKQGLGGGIEDAAIDDTAKVSEKSMAEKVSEIQSLLRHVEQMEQCMIHEASAVRGQMRHYPTESDVRIAASGTALSQLTIFLPLSLTSTDLINKIARLEQAPVEKYIDGVVTRDFLLRDDQPGLMQKLTDIRLLGWGSVALGSVLLNSAAPYEMVVGLCGMGSLLVGGAAIKNRSDRDADLQNELAASAAVHRHAVGHLGEKRADSTLQKLARFVALDDETFTQYAREEGPMAALEQYGHEIVTPDAAPEFQNPNDLTDICGLFEQARDLAYWMVELEAGTISPRPAAYATVVESVANKPAPMIGQILDTLIEGLIEFSGCVKRDEAFHLKTTLQRFRPKIGFTYGRQAVMRVYDAALNRINKLLASDLDRAKYDGAETVDEAAVAQWSAQDHEDMQNALAEGRVRLNNAVLPTARGDLKTELSNHVFAALRHRGSRCQRATIAQLIGRVVTASGTRFDEAMRSDLIERLQVRPNFDASQIMVKGKTRVQWIIRGGRFIVASHQAYQWNNPASGEGAVTFDCVREVFFDVHSGRFDGEFYHVG